MKLFNNSIFAVIPAKVGIYSVGIHSVGIHFPHEHWIPVFTGMTMRLFFRSFYIFLLLTIWLSSICNSNLQAQNINESQNFNTAQPGGLRAGLYSGLNANYHTSDFKALPGVPNCCPEFSSGFGFGLNFGGILEYRISQMIAVQLRANSVSHDARLSNIESELLNLDGTEIKGEFQHTLDISLSSYGFELLGDLRIAPAASLIAGGRFGIITTHRVEQAEEIIKPDNKGVFVDTGTRTRNKYSGEIPDASSTIFSLLGGFRYELPLNKSASAVLAPELMISIGLTPIIRDYSWSAHSIRLGAAILFDIGGSNKEPETAIIKDSKPTKSEPVFTEKTPAKSKPFDIEIDDIKINGIKINNIKINAVGVDGGIERPVTLITIDEFLSTNMHPMLNYIFFDENSAVIPGRYAALSKKEADNFRLGRLSSTNTLATYYNLLNIIGLRMRNNPEAKIIISGYNSDEKGNKPLSESRAESAAGYLSDIWGIPMGRMEIKAGSLPPNPSPSGEPDGNEENRRVEITSPNFDITAPVVTSDTLRIVSPPIIRFYPKVSSEKEIGSWKITARQNGKLLKEISGQGSPPEKIDWAINGDKEKIPTGAENVEYKFEAAGGDGKSVSSELVKIPVELRSIRQKIDDKIEDKRIDIYSLISFEFDKYQLDRQNSKIVEFIKNNISDKSKVVVTGYTDRFGEAEYNLQLSERRAAEVARELNIPRSNAFGSGENTEIYDNDLPEGRFYSRTVEVRVETPLKWK